ncbi:MAG: hypothetical protein Q8P99_02910 [bacterium]|nr:hypothetical protein [bacterium]
MVPQGLKYAGDVKEQFSGPNLRIGWPKRFLTFTFVVFVAVFFVYLGLAFGYQAFLRNSISNIEAELGGLSSQISIEQKENLRTLYSQVTNIRQLLREHTLTSQVFTLFEAVTSESVVYTNFSLATSEREVEIEGFAGSYEDLVSQLVLLEDTPQIEKLTLEDSAFQNGLIAFRLRVTLADNILFPPSL